MDNEIAAIHETNKMTSQSEKSKLSGLGARLRKTRESMHLTQKEAAARLYLNPKIVEIIENEAFFDGPPMTFMRGYLRSYARLLNFPENDIKHAIEELELNTIPPTVTAPALQANPIYRGDKYIRWITYLIVLTLISLVTLWWSSHSKYVINDVPSSNQSSITATSTNQTTPPVANGASNQPNTTDQTLNPQPSTILPMNHDTMPATSTPGYVAPQIKEPVSQPLTMSPPSTTISPTLGGESNTDLSTTAENPANAILNANEVKEKPVSSPKKAHRRHQYHPIENMDIPEPD